MSHYHSDNGVFTAETFTPLLVTEQNINLSSAQKELLLWHNKLGISMPWVQELIRAHTMEEPNDATSITPQLIQPKVNQASSCPIPICQSCQLSRAKQHKPQVVKSKVMKSSEGTLSRNKYIMGDMVLMGQYVVKTP